MLMISRFKHWEESFTAQKIEITLDDTSTTTRSVIRISDQTSMSANPILARTTKFDRPGRHTSVKIGRLQLKLLLARLSFCLLLLTWGSGKKQVYRLCVQSNSQVFETVLWRSARTQVQGIQIRIAYDLFCRPQEIIEKAKIPRTARPTIENDTKRKQCSQKRGEETD